MATPFLSEIRIFSFSFPPKGWAFCNGQLLPINQNQALFALLGTTYGGDGRVNFALPDLRGRAPMHLGNVYVQGERAGSENVTLLTSQVPAHTHTVACSSTPAAQFSPVNGVSAKEPNGNMPFAGSATPGNLVNPVAIANAGGNQPHANMGPSLVLSFCIALQGIFPSRN
jgi:microcystin-dependent protein